MKKTVTLLLALTMVCACFSCGLAAAEEEPVTITVAVPVSGTGEYPYSEMGLFQDVEAATNVHAEFVEVDISVWAEKVPLMLSSNAVPDVFFGNVAIPDSVIYTFGQQGVLIPLEDLIEEYTTNIKALFEQYPEYRQASVFEDGHIYSLPCIDAFPTQIDGAKMNINMYWLEALGLEIPTTIDELYDVLVAFKENDANGNGDPNDEIVCSFLIDDYRERSAFLAPFGVTENDDHVMVRDGKILFTPIQPGYRQAVEWLAKLYAEGLLDPETLTQDYETRGAKADSEEGIGLSATKWQPELVGVSDSELDPWQHDRYNHILPVAGPDGYQIDHVVSYPLGYNGNRVFLTYSNPYPEETMKWLDYMFDSGDMSKTVRFGIKGIGWGIAEDGRWYFNHGIENPEDKEKNDAYTPYNNVPMFLPAHIFELDVCYLTSLIDIDGLEMLEKLTPYLEEEPYPTALKYSVEDGKERAQLLTDLDTYVSEMLGHFITNGITDDAWDEYVKTVEAYNVERYLEITQTAYDLFNS